MINAHPHGLTLESMAESRPKVDDTVDQKLKNKFFLIRHGQVNIIFVHSKSLIMTLQYFLLQAFSNTEGILVSNPDIGIKKYGLTDTGKQQAKEVSFDNVCVIIDL